MLPRFRPILVGLAALGLCGIGGADALAAPAQPSTAALTSTVPPDDDLADDDLATPGALDDAAERSASAPYRIEMFMELSGLGMDTDPDVPLITGVYADGRTSMLMDLGALFGDMLYGNSVPPELQGVDLTMEYVIDGTDMYLKAPFFSVIAEQAGPSAGPLEAFVELGDGWGYIDMTAIAGMAPGDIAGSMGVAGADPAAFFSLLADVEGAEGIGTEEIRGVSTSGVRADVSVAQLMEAQGVDPTQMGSADMDAIAGLTVPIEVWIDKDGFVRRFVFDLDADAIAAAAEAQDEVVDTSMLAGLHMAMTMEMFDYGAEDIVVDVPTEFVDITDAFAELMAL